MTDETEALIKLLAKIESGHELSKADIWNAFSEGGKIGVYALQIPAAYDGSLNAAKALHESLLHEACEVKSTASIRYGAIVEIHHRMRVLGRGERQDLAHAWLIAILKALIAEATS